jgi:hypothetical protein
MDVFVFVNSYGNMLTLSELHWGGESALKQGQDIAQRKALCGHSKTL